ncbi:MAG TPA: hypothetical protein VHL77_00690 [Ferruginibacter sp.]|jgi:hypothetical protein|nr:hypothetical protein [Ferruginibacter sp.]
MANLFSVNVYQIDGQVLARDQSIRMGFATTGVQIQDCISSPTRSLSSGYNVYSLILVPDQGLPGNGGKKFYIQETYAALATLIG